MMIVTSYYLFYTLHSDDCKIMIMTMALKKKKNLKKMQKVLAGQVYIPLYIIVMSSWVTFWLVKTEKGQETPARLC